ncbi:protein of unknown function, might belong to Transposase [Shewanella benthica]|uniref:Transposase n=1 Tax=Shewanella benthica TaxID=43661 RepID=A0A330M526_9GAMM|nr:protein of unknown function, might belong to Transposase [Shewanella benthica]
MGHIWTLPVSQDIALLACMMYVDLNPIRAGITNTLQASDYTSIQQRIAELSTSDKTLNQMMINQHQP